MAYEDGKGVPYGSISVVILLGIAVAACLALFYGMTESLMGR
jgi:hypothetical protein